MMIILNQPMRGGVALCGERADPAGAAREGEAGPGSGTAPARCSAGTGSCRMRGEKAKLGSLGLFPIAARAPRASSPAAGRGAARSPRAGAGLCRLFVGYMIFSRPVLLAWSYFLTSSWSFKIREKKNNKLTKKQTGRNIEFLPSSDSYLRTLSSSSSSSR